MATNRTFSMIKPDAFADGHTGGILTMMSEAGFKIKAIKVIKLTDEKAGQFYEINVKCL